MKIYLMRHGLAVERGTPGYDDDRERPLTPKGKRKTRRAAAALARLEIGFDFFISSPLVRARQTAELLRDKLNRDQKVHLTEALAPGSNPRDLVDLLHDLPGSSLEILLVGHEPDLSQLASVFLAGRKDGIVVFKKGGLAKLAVEQLRAGRCATLEWLLTPRQLELISR